MPKITFMGAGSTVFAKNVLGDALLTPELSESVVALYDIDAQRLEDSRIMMENINRTNNNGKATIETYLGVENRKDALRGANYVVNAIQVGFYDPCTIIDFEVPKRFGLRQTIADTLGIGGIFRALRTIPVLLDFAKDMEEVCPNAWFLNYTNPMAMLTGAMLRLTHVKTVGLCHSVQGCTKDLFKGLDIPYDEKVQWKIAGINHQAWLLECTRDGEDLYPLIKEKAFARTDKHNDMVRYEIMRKFGYYVTESSEHNAEYMPYFIKNAYPELIERFNIPLDEYPRRCIEQIANWEKMRKSMLEEPHVVSGRSHEYACRIMEAMETNAPFTFGGNVLNTGLIPNLPSNACVEVTCIADKSGVRPVYVGDLPEQCAALNRTNINVQLLTIEAARTLQKDYIYQAAFMDPHTASELSLDDIVSLCDALIDAHGEWLPKYH